MNGEVRLVEDVPGAFAALVADELRSFAAGATPTAGAAGTYRFALSGGTTARRGYERLAAEDGLPWHLVEVLWGDERCVPPTDPDSNQLLAREALLGRIGPVAAVHPMSCEVGADAYEEIVRAAGGIDLLHLGLGPDGHTASLFPSSAGLEAPPERLVVENVDPSGRNPHPRMTLTYSAINAARLVVFTVAGEEKREAFAAVMAGVDLPAARVAAERVLWLVDEAAAG